VTIDVYTATGTKKGTVTLPKDLFEVAINEGLMHQAVVRQQSNRRSPVAHTKTRGEIRGSTRKLFAQKGTGRARRGPVRSPLLKGGSKAFGPRSNANFTKDMPRTMRRKALFSCLSLQAKAKNIIGLENYPDTVKTKDFVKLLEKLPVDIGRNILFVTAGRHESLSLSARNVGKVKTILAAYLNPEDVLRARHIVFLVDAIKKAEEVFSNKEKKEIKEKKEVKEKVSSAKKTSTSKKKSVTSSTT